MKKSVFILVLLFSAFAFQSCEKDESLDPRAQLNPGLYARLDITSKVIKSYDVDNSYFGGLLTSPSGKIVKYNLYVKRRNGFGVASEFALVKTITSFPFDLKIYVADIAAALNVPATDLAFGDEYYFYAESFDAEGHRADYYSLSSTVQGAPGMKQGYRFRTTSQNEDFFNNPANIAEYDNYVNP
ncbi:MAG: hypothetical protein RIT03_816 [Bacteroidota bacterium]|jgi:hypothetical protein